MPSTIKFSQASKHSNTIAVTYKLIQRSFFGLMSALLVTTLSVAMVGQNSLSVMAQDIENDPVVQAQEQIETSLIEINFKNLKSIDASIKYASNLAIKAKGTGTVSFLATAQLDLDKVSVDIPFGITSGKEVKEIKEDYQKSKLEVIENFKLKLLEVSSDENLTNLKQNSNDKELESQKAVKDENILIKRITLTSKNSNQELQSLSKSKKKLSKEDKLLQIVKKDTATSKKNKSNDVIDLSDIDSIRSEKMTDDQKNEILNKAKEQKKLKLQKENEKFISVAQKEFKDKNIKEAKEKQKSKKQDIESKLNKGQIKKQDISNQDIYELGEEAKTLGLEIDSSKFEKENQVQRQNDKIQFEIEKKNDPLLNKIVSTLFNSILGTVQASAFSPGIYSENLNHNTYGSHFGTVSDVYGGGTNNGTDIGFWYRGSNQSNQLISLNYDDTIRVNGKCFDMSDYGKINNGQNANGVKVHLWDCNGGFAQKWVYDDEGRIRLKYASNYCLDANSGQPGEKFYVYQCAWWTERFRGGDYEMKLIAERGTPYGNSLDVGHSWVAIQKLDWNSNVSENSSYGLWPYLDDTCNQGYADKCCAQNAQTGQWICNDTGLGNINVNRSYGYANYDTAPDYLWPIDLHNNSYNYWNAKQKDRAAFKVKNISKSYADYIRTNNGFKVTGFTSNQSLINNLTTNMQNSTNWLWFQYYLPTYSIDIVMKAFLVATGITNAYSTNYDYVKANCTSYAMNLWSAYGGINNYNSLWWGVLPLPNELYNSMKLGAYVY